MNADQYGFSDLNASYELVGRLGDEVEWRICEVELGVDGVIDLMRRLDAVVAMRFHAAIFALSQQATTLGIDYDLAGRGKVGQLFTEMGRADDVRGIETLSPSWLADRLTTIAPLKVV